MFFAGYIEGFDPAFAIVPGALRNSIYILRLLLGILLFIASADWLIDAHSALHETTPYVATSQPQSLQEQPA
jgi:cytochrome c oxidase cbb3-type subunit 1